MKYTPNSIFLKISTKNVAPSHSKNHHGGLGTECSRTKFARRKPRWIESRAGTHHRSGSSVVLKSVRKWNTFFANRMYLVVFTIHGISAEFTERCHQSESCSYTKLHFFEKFQPQNCAPSHSKTTMFGGLKIVRLKPTWIDSRVLLVWIYSRWELTKSLPHFSRTGSFGFCSEYGHSAEFTERHHKTHQSWFPPKLSTHKRWEIHHVLGSRRDMLSQKSRGT